MLGISSCVVLQSVQVEMPKLGVIIEVLGEFHPDEFLKFDSHFFTGTRGAVVNL